MRTAPRMNIEMSNNYRNLNSLEFKVSLIFKVLLFPFFVCTKFLLLLFLIKIISTYESHNYQLIWGLGCFSFLVLLILTYSDICIKKVKFDNYHIIKTNIFGQRKISYRDIKGYRIFLNGISIESKISNEKRIFINTRHWGFGGINTVMMTYFENLAHKK